MSVFRSTKHIYVQIIDDDTQRTLATASTLSSEFRALNQFGGNIDAAKVVGKMIAKAAQDAQVESVVFDRNGYLYHGRVKALADAAREGGLVF
jgi:large subunit ribosomal protein L18